MVNMSPERISRWKCIFCGSKQKKIIDVLGSNDKLIGYSILCCHCGHMDNFALTKSAMHLFVRGESAIVGRTNIRCGLHPKALEFCAEYECPYRPKKNTCNKHKKPAVHPTIKVEEKLLRKDPTPISGTENVDKYL